MPQATAPGTKPGLRPHFERRVIKRNLGSLVELKGENAVGPQKSPEAERSSVAGLLLPALQSSSQPGRLSPRCGKHGCKQPHGSASHGVSPAVSGTHPEVPGAGSLAPSGSCATSGLMTAAEGHSLRRAHSEGGGRNRADGAQGMLSP